MYCSFLAFVYGLFVVIVWVALQQRAPMRLRDYCAVIFIGWLASPFIFLIWLMNKIIKLIHHHW